MKKLLALAAAGVIALATTAATTAPSYAAYQGNWKQDQQWKKFQGGQKFKNPGGNWQGQKFKNFGGNWQSQKNLKWQGQKKFSKFQGQQNWQKNWNGPKNWKGPKPPFHGNYPHKPPFKKYVKFPKHHHHNNFVGPFVFGLALGAIANNAFAYDYAGLTPHQLWCLREYPNTYDPDTNLFYIRPGVVAVCVSPYSSGPVGYIPY